jgi:hypothetical protein
VLVQREVESGRSPLASITPFLASPFGTTSPNTLAAGGMGAGRNCNWFRKENTLGSPRSHSPRGWKNKLPTEEIVTDRTLTLPTKRLPCEPLSEIAVFRSQGFETRSYVPFRATVAHGKVARTRSVTISLGADPFALRARSFQRKQDHFERSTKYYKI